MKEIGIIRQLVVDIQVYSEEEFFKLANEFNLVIFTYAYDDFDRGRKVLWRYVIYQNKIIGCYT